MQRQLESLGVSYTGSNPRASQLAMSKSASKEQFAQAGVPTPAYELFDCGESIETIAAQKIHRKQSAKTDRDTATQTT